MTALANLQGLFQNHVVHGTQEAVDIFVGDQKASAAERAGVYYDAYRLRLMEILRIDFPGLCALTTADEFDALGARYLDAHPSRYPTVRWFGQHLWAFLASDSVFAKQPYLAEMALFEWARGKAFDAANAVVVSIEDLGAVPPADWPSLCLDFHPALQRSECAWNIGPIWRAINAEEPLPEPVLLDKPAQWAVWRRDLTVYWRSLGDAEAWALDEFAKGMTFADVCDGLCDWIAAEEVPVKAAGMLGQWITEGLVSRLRSGEKISS
jgi:hypothetical protein